MKKKNRGKKNFIDFDDYMKQQNNLSCSKQEKKGGSNNNVNHFNNKQKLNFQNCLENLCFYFPNFSRELIEDVYQENDENFSRTKDKLRELSEIDNNENKINENNMCIEEEQKEKKKNKKKNFVDISEKYNLQIADEDDSEHSVHSVHSEDNKNYNKNTEDNKNYNKNNINIDNDKEDNNINNNKIINNNDDTKGYNNLLQLKEKNIKEYTSQFDEDNFNNNNINTPITLTPNLKYETMIDDYLFDQNIEFIHNCFPSYEKEKIVQKICDFNFDINSVVSNILNEIYSNNNGGKTNENIKTLDANDIEEILINFENMEENDLYLDTDILTIQKDIENSIKKNNLFFDNEKKNKKDENKAQENEEYFLDKNINDIQTPQIKNDLTKLIKQFPNEGEYNIKLAYYSYMDYKSTFNHFDSKDGTKNLALKNLLNSNNDNKIINKDFVTQKKIKKNVKKKSEIEKRRLATLQNILENKPMNWKLEEDKNSNEKDFIAIRNRLYREAKNFFAMKKYGKGQELISRAKRYQQEIEKIAKKKGLNQFFNNNNYNNNSKEIDLHGLHVEESKLIINKKIEQLRNKKEEDNLKYISLTIITGVGSHSEGGRGVLFPELKFWLKNKNKIKVDGKQEDGVLYITIY